MQKVIPLNETSGIIEWVDNLASLRSIIGRLLKERPDAKPLKQKEYDTFATKVEDPKGNVRFDSTVDTSKILPNVTPPLPLAEYE